MTFTSNIFSKSIKSRNHSYLNNQSSYANLNCSFGFSSKIRYINMPSSKLWHQYLKSRCSIVQKSKSQNLKIISNIHDQI